MSGAERKTDGGRKINYAEQTKIKTARRRRNKPQRRRSMKIRAEKSKRVTSGKFNTNKQNVNSMLTASMWMFCRRYAEVSMLTAHLSRTKPCTSSVGLHLLSNWPLSR